MLDLSALLAAHMQDEDKLLNNIWIGLLSVEALMVLGVALRGLVGAVASSKLFVGGGQNYHRPSGSYGGRKGSGYSVGMGMGMGMSPSPRAGLVLGGDSEDGSVFGSPGR